MTSSSNHNMRATIIGMVAILLWALLALFTTWAKGIPTFQLLTLTFFIAFVSGLIVLACKGKKSFQSLKQRPIVWIISVSGLFGYHLFYFIALHNAPAVEASLIAFLWPLLIVFFSTLLPGERLYWFHIAGTLTGLAGAILIVTKGQSLSWNSDYYIGYLAAIVCALTWSGYSVINRKFKDVPSDAVTGFCGATAFLGLIFHLGTETWVTPTGTQSLAILALGLGPVGLAFFVWDYGTKHGDIQVLGALSYGAPLLSTLLLISVGLADASWITALACLLIVGGAFLASAKMLKSKPSLKENIVPQHD
ncbi:membrane protein [Kiloniella spongiae]|uniref:Membrane protein n=1 Tax=Kiloniella spongiae TaxID=1489064 RepID=A0A0H2MDQ1_9PROT|nr:EamA family transporter [Kiloniella spongiae]KLN60483.1 membrane protein [Kiloniella spongiae]